MNRRHYVFHPSMREHVELLMSAVNLEGQAAITRAYLNGATIEYVANICPVQSEPSGIFAEYPAKAMQLLASGKGRAC